MVIKCTPKKMLKLQKRAARVITSSGLEERSSKIFQMLKWTKIQSILKKRELVMTFKALRGMAPEYLTPMFHVSVNQTYQLPNNHPKLYLPKPKTIFLKRSFSYTGAVSWNQMLMEKLPITKIPETSISSFKRLIDGLIVFLNWEVILPNHTFM